MSILCYSLSNPQVAIIDNTAADPAVDDPEKFAMPDNAVALGMLPNVGVVAADDDPVGRAKDLICVTTPPLNDHAGQF